MGGPLRIPRFYVVFALLVLILSFATVDAGRQPGNNRVGGGLSNSTNGNEDEKDSIKETATEEGVAVECVLEGTEMKCDGEVYVHEEAHIKPGTTKFTMYIVICLIFVCTAGMVSGLQLGLLSLDHNNLQILINAGEPDEQRNAKRILPLVRRHHLLLVTLLVINASCMEALPIFLDRLMSPIAAIIVSVTLVLMFGEIIPQAVCSRWGLKIGSFLSPVVWCFIVATFVISWPISKLLDCLLGESHGGYYRRGELKELLKLQQDADSLPQEQRLTPEESRIMHAAIDLKEKTAGQHMTPLQEVYMLSFDGVIDGAVLQRINELGHSRIPVYRSTRNDIMGMILTKELIMANPEKSTPVHDITLHRMPTVGAKMPLYEVLSAFQKSRAHMAVVLSDNDHITNLGVLTLEDVIEELLGVELEDEFDRNGRIAGVVTRATSSAIRDRRPASGDDEDLESGGTALLSPA